MESTVPSGYAEHAPPTDLVTHVMCFWTSLRQEAGRSVTSRVLPDGCVDIIFTFGTPDDEQVGELTDAFAVGAMTKPLVVDGPGPRLFIGVRFRPGFAFAAFGVPASEMTDARLTFELIERDAARELDHISAQVTNEGRLAATVELVRRRLFGIHVTPAVPRSVRVAVQRIVGTAGNVRIAALAEDIGITRQQLAKQFATHVGLTPKMLARVARTQAALARADAARAAYPRHVDWSGIACDLGYYDQPHFIDDFKAITGSTPGDWFGSS